MTPSFGPRRGTWIRIDEERSDSKQLNTADAAAFNSLDLIYRSLCAMLYNYVPMSGHPGGSISSGRIVAGLLYGTMDYDFRDPDRQDADVISYAAGHKALGLYAMWALRNEIVRIGAPELLPASDDAQLRLEDLLGFRRNPVTSTPLFRKFRARALDGHPTPATPFVRLSTGASGVGLPASLGLALAARDACGENAPAVHIVEGEGGLTPGRVAEALAAAGTASLGNAFLHIDWNQASIDSNAVCRDEDTPGDYVQWDPRELAYLHDWNVVDVTDGLDYHQVTAAQQEAAVIRNGQPTAIVYRTVKGWQYGIEGRSSHGAGHKLCSTGFFEALEPLIGTNHRKLPTCCDLEEKRCAGPESESVMEECFWEALTVVRGLLEEHRSAVCLLAGRIEESRRRLNDGKRTFRDGAPRIEAVYEAAATSDTRIPEEMIPGPGTNTTLRAELGRVLNHYNAVSDGCFLVSAADLLGSTSVNMIADGFAGGYFNAVGNPGSRTLSVGGICEDAMAGVASGLSAWGHHIGVASSYGAFMAPLGHIAARLHAIGNQAKGTPYKPMILVCAHAGLKTGEDGPTHADPQALQMLQENFPGGTAITLTPWEPQEIWHLVGAALARRPALIAPFVTRPTETVPDRKALRLAPASDCRTGLYRLRRAGRSSDGTIVLQGSGEALTFIQEVLPRLDSEGVDCDIYYVAGAELFDALPRAEQEKLYPESAAREAMGITGFTIPTMYRWILSRAGRALSLHPFAKGHFLGSGQAEKVLAEAGLDAEGQYAGVRRYLDATVKA